MWWVVSGLLLLVPLVASAVSPRMLPSVLGLGAALAGIEWAIAYRSNQVDHGGDWQPGGELLAYTGLFAVMYFVIWLGLALLGATVGRTLRRRPSSRSIT